MKTTLPGIRILPLVALLSGGAGLLLAQTDARNDLNSYLSGIVRPALEHRFQTVTKLSTRADAERRLAEVRKEILQLIGGLPPRRDPVRVKEFGTIQDDGFRIEKIAYESLPDFWVTANVYVPAAANRRFPAVVLTPGHGPGKESQYSWAANLARNGIISLAVDALGQGERLQHFDPELEASKIERLGEHEHASLSTLLIGQHVSRYFINDAMRGIDYLIARPDVDSAHLGAFGCSGGGTVTAYLGALDPRVSVIATACYLTSFDELLASTGAQDAEQTLPNSWRKGSTWRIGWIFAPQDLMPSSLQRKICFRSRAPAKCMKKPSTSTAFMGRGTESSGSLGREAMATLGPSRRPSSRSW